MQFVWLSLNRENDRKKWRREGSAACDDQLECWNFWTKGGVPTTPNSVLFGRICCNGRVYATRVSTTHVRSPHYSENFGVVGFGVHVWIAFSIKNDQACWGAHLVEGEVSISPSHPMSCIGVRGGWSVLQAASFTISTG